MAKYEMIIERKEGRRYIDFGTHNTDRDRVLASFAEDMRAKFLRGSRGYSRVEYRNNYDGTETVKFSHGNGYRTTYILPQGMMLEEY